MSGGIVTTIGQKCRRCYSCVRECPAIAIRVLNGQAVVIEDRCISCGHCVKVCSQNAKMIISDLERVEMLLEKGNAAIIVAPSFAVSFNGRYNKVPTALRKAGFQLVCETAFGADLISPLYAHELESSGGKTLISSACPAVYIYIQKYYSELIPNLAPVVSPMVAMGRYLKAMSKNDLRVIFAGPCVAKKSEYMDEQIEGAIDAVLTFSELKELLENRQIDIDSLEESEFDPPLAGSGKVFPIAGGLLKTAEIENDLLTREILVVEGKDKLEEVISEIAEGKIQSKFIDILFCEGCISGPAIDSDLNYYSRRDKIIRYIHEKSNIVDKNIWKSNLFNARKLDLKRDFTSMSQRRPMPDEVKIREILERSNKFNKSDELNCGACGYKTCREYAIAIAKDLAEEDMCLPYLIDKLEQAYDELKNTQEQLQSAERLASIGQLAAGVAHEINNPLGTILLYSSMLERDFSEKIETMNYLDDVNMIIEETKRCKNIVSNLLNFARQGKLTLSEFDLNDILIKIVKNLKLNPFFKKISISLSSFLQPAVIEADPDQLNQVFLNILTNACEALEERENKQIEMKLYGENGYIIVEVKDNGIGVPKENLGKLFTPFFSTKKIGKGTGLGLAITYGIIKMHKGDINVRSIVNEGTTFIIKLPFSQKNFSQNTLGVQ